MVPISTLTKGRNGNVITKLFCVQRPAELVPHGENCPCDLGTNCGRNKLWELFMFFY